jgi:hypothetical protein
MKFTTQWIFVTLIILYSCGENSHKEEHAVEHAGSKNPSDSLFQEVMAGHDEGMAKIGRLKKYSSRLGFVIDSINKSTPGSKRDVLALQRVKDSLDAATGSMFTWMEGFTADTLTGMEPDRLEYLKTQQASVTLVRNRIMNSLRLYDSLDTRFK